MTYSTYDCIWYYEPLETPSYHLSGGDITCTYTTCDIMYPYHFSGCHTNDWLQYFIAIVSFSSVVLVPNYSIKLVTEH